MTLIIKQSFLYPHTNNPVLHCCNSHRLTLKVLSWIINYLRAISLLIFKSLLTANIPDLLFI